ncbi:MAG: NAD-dependent epimerase/dehydratase family protein [Clostridiales bacterium]|nr:NAD-dependent epimerase/dehydratase family protein [Clostridiales bacterium]
MRVIVTGGAGFIGSNLVHAIIGENAVLVIDDLSTGRPENIHPAAAMRTMDILDGSLSTVFAEFAPEIVVHLAAQSSVSASLVDPARDWAVNVEGTRAVSRAARESGVRLVLSASSAAVYGEPAELPLTESSPVHPANPYGESKLAAEGALAEELAGSPCDYASLRFANVYGPRQDATGEGGVVAAFCSALAEGRAPVIHGDGGQTRDFIFVGDVVSALIAAIYCEVRLGDEAAPGGAAYNISTGSEVSVHALADSLRPVSEFLRPFEYTRERPGDVRRSALDASRAREAFGWHARVPLDTGLAATYRWFASR